MFMKKYNAVIFDLDGTLLNSMEFWQSLAAEYLRSRNILPPDDLAEDLSTLDMHQAVDFMLENFDLHLSHETVYNDLVQIANNYYCNQAIFKPGVEKFLQKLRANDIALMIFSAAPEELVYSALRHLHATEYFNCGVLSCEKLDLDKTQAQAFLAAAEYCGFPVAEIVIFEDAPHAARAAKSAGFTLAVVADKTANSEELRKIADFYIEKSYDEISDML